MATKGYSTLPKIQKKINFLMKKNWLRCTYLLMSNKVSEINNKNIIQNIV